MTYYVGLLDGSGDVWGVTIPDVPGMNGGGATPEEAIGDAISAFREVAAMMVADGTPLPKPRTLSEIIRDPEVAEDVAKGATAVMVPLLLDKGRSVRANISLDAGLLEAFDAEASRRGLTRSAFFVSAAMDKIIGAPGRKDGKAA